MKKEILITLILVIAIIFGWFVTHPTESVSQKDSYQTMKNETQEAAEATKDYVRDKNNEAIAQLEEQVRVMKDELHQMKTDSNETGATVKTKTHESMDALEAQIDALGSKLNKVKDNAHKKSTSVGKTVDEDLEKLKESTQRLWHTVEAKTKAAHKKLDAKLDS